MKQKIPGSDILVERSNEKGSDRSEFEIEKDHVKADQKASRIEI